MAHLFGLHSVLCIIIVFDWYNFHLGQQPEFFNAKFAKHTHIHKYACYYESQNMQRNNFCFNPISRCVPVKLGYCLHAWNKYLHWVVCEKASSNNWILNKYCCYIYKHTHTLPLSCSSQYNIKNLSYVNIRMCLHMHLTCSSYMTFSLLLCHYLWYAFRFLCTNTA